MQTIPTTTGNMQLIRQHHWWGSNAHAPYALALMLPNLELIALTPNIPDTCNMPTHLTPATPGGTHDSATWGQAFI